MCKKLLIAALAVVVGVGVVSSTRLGSHIRLCWNKVSREVNQQIPPETEIERLKMELDNLTRLDDRYYDQVARQKREVQKLEAKVKTDKANLAKRESELKEMRLVLASKDDKAVYHGFGKDKVQEQFNIDFKQFLSDEEGVKADDQNLEELRGTLRENEKKLQELGIVRTKMKVRLQTLAKELARERRLQTQSNLTLDDSHYSAVNQQINELEDRIEQMKIKRDMRGQSSRGPIRAHLEAQEEQKKLEQAAQERFGETDPKKVVITD